jgi:hypothetical protein
MRAQSFPAARSVAEAIEARWSRGELDGFAKLAAEALHEVDLAEFSLARIHGWVASTDQLPDQLNPSLAFGDPPITLWHGEDFVVDAYLWNRFASGIHDHKFSGAFVVVEGLTADCRFTFELDERLDERILLGRLRAQGVTMLRPGEVTVISPGPSFIHHPGHLELPTLTLCVRLVDDPRFARNYDYYMPGLAIGQSQTDYAAQRLALMQGLRRRPDQLYAYAQALIEGGPLVASLIALLRHCVIAQDLAASRALVAAVPTKHAGLRARVLEVVEAFHAGGSAGANRPSATDGLDTLLEDIGAREDRAQVLAGLGALLGI